MIIPNPTAPERSTPKGPVSFPPDLQESRVFLTDDHGVTQSVDLDGILKGSIGFLDSQNDILITGHEVIERSEDDDIGIDIDATVILESPEADDIGLVGDVEDWVSKDLLGVIDLLDLKPR